MLWKQLEKQEAELRETRQSLERREIEMNSLRKELTHSKQLLKEVLEHREYTEKQLTDQKTLKSTSAERETEL